MLWLISSAVLRGVLRVYFITFITLLGLIGSQCCKCAAKVDLLRGKNVELHRMTGWLRLSDILTCVWKLRRLPGGVWLGLVMIITALLSTAADLAVAFLVVPVQVPGSCIFTVGLVMDWTTPETFNRPPANSYPALIASNAQIYSDTPGCAVGIYTKVPTLPDPSFCGKETDVLGRWECNDLNMDATFDADVTLLEIENNLLKATLQYSNMTYTDIGFDTGSEETTHLAIWSSSIESDATGSPFNVLVSVDLNITTSDPKTMRTYKCTANPVSVDGEIAIPAILSQIESVSTLMQWAPGLEAILYEGDGTPISQYAQVRLEQYLNTMTMVQGGSNDVFSTPNDNLEYGCMVNKTQVSTGVFFLVIFTAFVLVATTLYWIVLLLIISKHAISRVAKRKSGVAVKNVKPVPDGVVSWMLQAARENVQGSEANAADAPENEKELKNWNFTMVDSNQGVARMVRERGNVVIAEEENNPKV